MMPGSKFQLKAAAIEAVVRDAERIAVIAILSAASWAFVIWVASCASEALL